MPWISPGPKAVTSSSGGRGRKKKHFKQTNILLPCVNRNTRSGNDYGSSSIQPPRGFASAVSNQRQDEWTEGGGDGVERKKRGGGRKKQYSDQDMRAIKNVGAVCFEFRRCLMSVYTVHMKATQFVYLIYCNPSQVCAVSLLPRSTERHVGSERMATLKRGAGSVGALLQ